MELTGHELQRPIDRSTREPDSRPRSNTPLALALMAPGLLVVGALLLYPLLVVLQTSLSGPEGLTLRNYLGFFSEGRSYTALMNTLQIAVLSTVGCVVVSLPLALSLRRSRRYRTLVRTMITLPLMVPVLIAGYSLTLFFAQNGLFNYLVVQLLHLMPERVPIAYSTAGVILGLVWRYFPFVAIIVAAGLESLDPSLEEAATSMGAGPIRVFRDVVLPLLVPSILTGSILAFVGSFGSFGIPLIMGRGQDVLSVLAYRYHAVYFDAPASSTVALVMVVVQVTVLSVYTRVLKRRMA